MLKNRIIGSKTRAWHRLGVRRARRTRLVNGKGRLPLVQPVFIRLTSPLAKSGGRFRLQVFFDENGEQEMTNDKPLNVLSKGKVQFNFIPPAWGGVAELADLVIIGQTVSLGRGRQWCKKDTPFRHPRPLAILDRRYYPAYYLPEPTGASRPSRWSRALRSRKTGCVPGGMLDVKEVKGRKPSGPYKYAIVALCDGATKVAEIDPCIIINPR